ncbi:MAG: MTH1187 family thiamine-binding protein [Bacteroidetes bacterium]|nr:MTH1187 family thiamine-binding protein [Bacteroidota bacterium]
MSVLMEFAMFPTDVGESKSKYVSRIVKMIDESGFSYQLTPMGTIVETESISEVLQLVEKSYSLLEQDSSRVYCTIKLDIRKGTNNRMDRKIESVEKLIGSVKK